MANEIETLGGLSVGGLSSAQKADLSGQPCRNCGELVEARYCHNCGQLAASFHRPVWSLVGETISDSLALDGRISRTLPLLFLRPGRLTVNYTSGARAKYVPPFRLFLLASLLFFFTVFALLGKAEWLEDLKLSSNGQAEEVITIDDGDQIFDENGKVDREAAIDALSDGEPLPEAAREASDRVFDIVDDPRLFIAGLEKWAPRLSLLLVPSTIFLLTLLHFWRRRLYIYHHAIHALHLHTWLYLSATLLLVLAPLIGGWLVALYVALMVVYVCRSLMVTGDTGIFMASARTFLLIISWIILVSITTVVATVFSAIEI